MMHRYFQDLVQGLQGRLAQSAQESVARKLLALQIAKLGVKLFAGSERVAWCGVLTPFELLQAHGVTSCFTEFVGAMLASSGAVEPMLAAAEQAGYSTDACSYHRAVFGAARQGAMPVPDFLIATSAPCSGGLALIENLAGHFGKDLFVLQVPYRNDPAAVEYLAGQLRAMTAFVAGHLGRPLDPARLGEVIESSNRARQLLQEAYQHARAVPSPARRRDLVNLGIVLPLFFGTPEAQAVARTYRDEFARKVERGIAGIPGERLRLLWIQNRIQFDSPLEALLEEEYQAAVVIDELNDLEWEPVDPQDPYPGLARRILSTPLSGPIAQRLDNLKRQARLYRVQGAIHPCHWGCRQGTGARGLIADGLRQVGVPMLSLEVDCVDPRNFSEGQLRTRLQAFLETLAARAEAERP
jgi:benzoyl-CoA reductase/2-hydroxyglutaryl-CoA dehydratase subunit BcrC/BadD/HgdB